MEDDSLAFDANVSGDTGYFSAAPSLADSQLAAAQDIALSNAATAAAFSGGGSSDLVSSSLSSDVPAITATGNALASIGNSIANIFRGANGQPGNIFGSTGTGTGSIAGVASSLTRAVSSFLPLIFIGFVLYFLFNKAGRKH